MESRVVGMVPTRSAAGLQLHERKLDTPPGAGGGLQSEWKGFGVTARLEFSRKTKERRLAMAGWLCEAVWDGKRCGVELTAGRVEFHHEIEAERGGDNSISNCRSTCIACHRALTKQFVQAKAKAERQRAVQLKSKPESKHRLPGHRKAAVKIAIGGGVKPRVEKVSHLAHLPRRELYREIKR